MDTAMEQSIALQVDNALVLNPKIILILDNVTNNTGWNNNNTNNTFPPNSSNFTNSTQSARRPRSNERKGKDRSVSFSTFQCNSTSAPNSSGHKPSLVDPNCSQIQEILSVLKSLQEDMASLTITKTPPYITQSNPPTSSRSFSSLVLPSPMVPGPCSTISSSPIPETADKAIINKERAEIYSFQRSLDNKFDHLSGSIERFISSISGSSSSDLVNTTSSD
ncbi:hypothetical protein RhiirC2_797531 [Rhizophagus irregularis]|uniref:Uncharacterized protein n=1 Tax=Rhizophagus irregularis TaxID=588596 RepID=A0A2N1M7X8_9GLOM|nr:hypothetical protein RhiirC2_797531 [Rhizophagus irregularis]